MEIGGKSQKNSHGCMFFSKVKTYETALIAVDLPEGPASLSLGPCRWREHPACESVSID